MYLKLTDAGRAAIADGANRRTNQVTVTKMALGDGSAAPGVDDSGRATLRNERLREAVTGSSAADARLVVQASFMGVMGEAAWEAREVGLVGRVGAGQEFLAAYGAVLLADDAIATVAPGVSTISAGVVEVVSSDAEVAVALTPGVTVAGASSFAALTDVPDGLVAGSYYRGSADGRLVPVSAAGVLSDVLTGLQGGHYPRVRVVGALRGLEGRTAAQLAAEVVLRRHQAGASLRTAEEDEWVDLGTPWAAVPAGWRLDGTFLITASVHATTRFIQVRAVTDGVPEWTAQVTLFAPSQQVARGAAVLRLLSTRGGQMVFQARRTDGGIPGPIDISDTHLVAALA